MRLRFRFINFDHEDNDDIGYEALIWILLDSDIDIVNAQSNDTSLNKGANAALHCDIVFQSTRRNAVADDKKHS